MKPINNVMKYHYKYLLQVTREFYEQNFSSIFTLHLNNMFSNKLTLNNCSIILKKNFKSFI